MLRAVIFDFDGVITDSEILHLRAFNRSLVPYGIEISTKDYYTDYLGFSDFDCYKALIDNGLLNIDEQQIAGVIGQKSKIFEELTRTEGRTIEGVHEFLKMLEESKVPMAICSGSLLTEIEVMLDEAKLRHFFAVIAIAAGECIVIEDSRWGLEAGNAAGMHTIAVTNSYEADQLTLAEKVVAKLNELTLDDLQRLCA
ncbi:MAG: HAD family hydrolase [Planctomycetota bacterium]|jgi:beta-phosphoglucomutase